MKTALLATNAFNQSFRLRPEQLIRGHLEYAGKLFQHVYRWTTFLALYQSNVSPFDTCFKGKLFLGDFPVSPDSLQIPRKN